MRRFISVCLQTRAPRALYCVAQARQEAGDLEGAAAGYAELLGREPAGSPWHAVAEQALASCR